MESNQFQVTNVYPVKPYTEAFYTLVQMIFFGAVIFLMLFAVHIFFVFIERGFAVAFDRALFLPTFFANNPILLFFAGVGLGVLFLVVVHGLRKGRFWHQTNGPFDVKLSEDGFQIEYKSVPVFNKSLYSWGNLKSVKVIDTSTLEFEKRKNYYLRFVGSARLFRAEFTESSASLELFVSKFNEYVSQK